MTLQEEQKETMSEDTSNNTLVENGPSEKEIVDNRNPFKNPVEATKYTSRTPLDVKQALMSAGTSILLSAAPIAYDKYVAEGDKKKFTKGDFIDLICYNLPGAIPLFRHFLQGTKLERFTAKIELGLKFGALIPVGRHIWKNGGLKNMKWDINFFMKFIPFVGNMGIPAIIKDPGNLAAIAGLTTTFGAPALYILLGNKKDDKNSLPHKILSTIPFVLGGLSAITNLFNRNKNNSQLNSTTGSAFNNGYNRYGYGGYSSPYAGSQPNGGNWLSDLSTLGMNMLRGVQAFNGQGGNYSGGFGNPFVGLSGANTVYGGGNDAYWNARRTPI